MSEKVQLTGSTLLAVQLAAKDKEIKALKAALIWCSGSPDFNEGGQAREGWLKLCHPLLHPNTKADSHE